MYRTQQCRDRESSQSLSRNARRLEKAGVALRAPSRAHLPAPPPKCPPRDPPQLMDPWDPCKCAIRACRCYYVTCQACYRRRGGTDSSLANCFGSAMLKGAVAFLHDDPHSCLGKLSSKCPCSDAPFPWIQASRLLLCCKPASLGLGKLSSLRPCWCRVAAEISRNEEKTRATRSCLFGR